MYYIHYYHPPPVIHSDMVYDPEHTTGLYQREPQMLWIVTSSSECYIWTHTDEISDYVTSMLRFIVYRSYISHSVSKCVMSFCLLNDYWLIVYRSTYAPILSCLKVDIFAFRKPPYSINVRRVKLFLVSVCPRDKLHVSSENTSAIM